MMPKLDMRDATREEVKEFDAMKNMLREHNKYSNRKMYYPAKMDEFDRIADDIQFAYRTKIADMQKVRRDREKENAKKRREEEERAEQHAAAMALLMLKIPVANTSRMFKHVKATPDPVRRSVRIREKRERGEVRI